MSQSDKLKLVHYALKGPAWTYWSESLQSDADVRVISAVFAKLAEKFDTPTHQRKVE